MTTATPSRPAPPRLPSAQARGSKPALTATIDPIRVLRRHLVGFIIAAIIGALLGTAAFFAFRKFYPLYSAEVLFEVRPSVQKANDVGVIDVSNDEMIFRIAQTETYLLTSREVLERALKSPDVRRTEWAKSFVLSDGRFDPENALDDLKDTIATSVVRSSNLFRLSWRSTNPLDVPTVLNAVAAAYIENRAERDTKVYDANLSLFGGQLRSTNTEIDEIDTEIGRLIKTANITDLEGTYRSAQAQKSQQLTQQLAEAMTRFSISQTAAGQVEEQLKGKLQFSASDVLDAERDPSVQEQISTIQAIKAELRRQYATRLPDDPMIKQTEARVQGMEAERDQKVNVLIRRNLEAKGRELANDVDRYGNAVKQIGDELDKNNLLLKDMTAETAKYVGLKTRRDHLEARRTADLQLINEVQLMRARADASRVQKALSALIPREPSFPKAQIMIPLGSLLLLGLTVGIVFLRELMEQRVKSASDIAVLPGAHVIGSIPDRDDDPTKTTAVEMVVRKHPQSVLSESYRQTSTTLLPLMDRNGYQTLLLVGGLPGSGTTTVATNLAAAAGAAGRKVVIVDANLRRPRLAEAVGVAGSGAGLADLLAGTAGLEEAIVDAGEGVSVIPAGSSSGIRVFDRVSNSAFDRVISQLRERFDLVIFDAPPVVISGDAMTLANKLDAAILVVRANQEHRGLVVRMINQLANSRCQLMGILLNRPRGIAGGYLRKNYAAMAEYSAKS